MNNKLSSLNNYLFEQMERLNDHDLTGEELQQEIDRSKAISIVASQIIQTGNLVLRARCSIDSDKVRKLPEFLD